MDLASRLRNFLDTEEGKKTLSEYHEKLSREEENKSYQIERIARISNFSLFVEKVISKYNSNEYRERWYKRGIEPPEDLLWNLFDYAEKYGRECDEKEYEKYGNTFTSALFFCNEYYFNMMVGQGCIVRIVKKES